MGRTYWAVVDKNGEILSYQREAAIFTTYAFAHGFCECGKEGERVVKVRVEIVEESDV